MVTTEGARAFFVCVFHLNTAYRDIIYMEHGGDKGDMYAQEREQRKLHAHKHIYRWKNKRNV